MSSDDNNGSEFARRGPPEKPANKPPKTAANGRGENGRFNKGCKPGPGRPAKSRPRSTPEELVGRAKQLKAEHEAWHLILSTYPPAIVRTLMIELTTAGQQIPNWVREQLAIAERSET